jgi:RNA polymerase sigma-70 factor (ECF subfamily)
VIAPTSPADRADLDRVFREHHGRVLAWLIRVTGDLAAAEEAVQEACIVALRQWPREGLPDNPAGWLAVVARNRALDGIRRERRRADRERWVISEAQGAEDSVQLEDERLRLIFTCCHPALSLDARVALTLRTVGGLSTPEIAHALLVSEKTLAQRLVRAKRKIRAARIPYEVPAPDRLAERLEGVLAVLYLIFNEGYTASSGAELVRVDVCDEALRLTGMLCLLMPAESEVRALYSLMLLTNSRRRSRVDEQGQPVLLDEQARSSWDEGAIRHGLAELDQAARHAEPGRYFVQAAIAAEHALAIEADATNWPRIARLYRTLMRIAPSPVVELNRLVAVAMAEGPEAAYPGLAALADPLDNYAYYHATRAELLRRTGRPQDAIGAYHRAIELERNEAQRAFLQRNLAELHAAPRAVE